MEKKSGSSWRLQSGSYLGEVSALCFLHPPSHLSPQLPYLVAGSGSQILVYELEQGTMLRSLDVFQGIRVHGIFCGGGAVIGDDGSIGFDMAVFGERRVKMFRLEIDLGHQQQVLDVGLRLLQLLPSFGNWVLDVSFIKVLTQLHVVFCLVTVFCYCLVIFCFYCGQHGGGECVAVGCSDNSVHVWDVASCNVVLHVQHPG